MCLASLPCVSTPKFEKILSFLIASGVLKDEPLSRLRTRSDVQSDPTPLQFNDSFTTCLSVAEPTPSDTFTFLHETRHHLSEVIMTSLKLNVYNPGGSGYAPRIKEHDWEAFRPIITQLHNQRVPRKTMLKRLRNEYDFAPTIGQLQAKMKEWKLKVYTKDTSNHDRNAEPQDTPVLENVQPLTDYELKAVEQWHYNPYCLAASSGFIEAWANDYRIHPAGTWDMVEQQDTAASNELRNLDMQDRALPPEYLAGGLLANSADPTWPVPTDNLKCEAISKAADYYYAVQAYQQAFSLYRTVYLYQRKQLTFRDKRLIFTILRCASSAVSEHQKNIMHSVITEIGSSPAIDVLDPLVMDCLQTASLSMLSSAYSDEESEIVRARAVAYVALSNHISGQLSIPRAGLDLPAMLYSFEHALLMQEHHTQILVSLLTWSKDTIDNLQYSLDDIFVGHTSCDEEFYRRVAQVLSGHLVQSWSRDPDESIFAKQQRVNVDQKLNRELQVSYVANEAIVAIAFMIVDASRFSLNAPQFLSTIHANSNLWFLGAAKVLKRATQNLIHMNEKDRCESFSRAYLERCYAPMHLRQKMYTWNGQTAAVVDSVGMKIAQSLPSAEPSDSCIEVASPHVITEDETFARTLPLAYLNSIEEIVTHMSPKSPEVTVQWNDRMPTPFSDRGSVSSFLSTHLRVVNKRLVPSLKSRATSPCDQMSIDSTLEWKFAAVTGLRSPASETELSV